MWMWQQPVSKNKAPKSFKDYRPVDLPPLSWKHLSILWGKHAVGSTAVRLWVMLRCWQRTYHFIKYDCHTFREEAKSWVQTLLALICSSLVFSCCSLFYLLLSCYCWLYNKLLLGNNKDALDPWSTIEVQLRSSTYFGQCRLLQYNNENSQPPPPPCTLLLSFSAVACGSRPAAGGLSSPGCVCT